MGSADPTYASPGGSLSVHGAAATKTVAFSRVTYAMTFAETGLPSGTNWSVTFGGATRSSTGNIVFPGTFNETYTFTVLPVAGYSSTPANGSITVAGQPTPQVIRFSAAASTATLLGLPAAEGYAVLGGIVASVVVGLLVVVFWKRGGKARTNSAQSPPPPGTDRPKG